MSHPTDNPNGGQETPTVPTPRPENVEVTLPDPERYSPAGDLEREIIQAEIRRRTEEPVQEDETEEEEETESTDED